MDNSQGQALPQEPVQTTLVSTSSLQDPLIMKSLYKYGFLAVILLAFVSLGAYYLGTRHSNQNVASEVNTIVTTIPTLVVAQVTPSIAQPQELSWKTVNQDLYGFTFTIPSTWIVKEVNRKSEPYEEFGIKRGHDCAEYTIQSPDNNLQMTIQPVCGYSDGGGLPLPQDAVTVKKKSDGDGIYARIFRSDSGLYSYVSAGEVEIDDSQGKHKEMYYAAHLNFITSTDKEVTGFVTFTYYGPDNLRELYLSQADQIVAKFLK
ncbi:MAG: hypothetical protein UZ22_OP11002000532 [Microgenomates bacterium OLB23]|nr:MAG: hypothetical protein UZ22_OP11002000532 [Microgenomates bacterium OLB23]